jgi:soluble lytic murein transglycosylase
LEGYIPAMEAAAYTGLDGTARTFFKTALHTEGASLYYRALSASYLKEAVSVSKTKEASDIPNTDDADFILNFFEFGVSEYVSPYIKQFSENLSIRELRAVAKALSDNEQWQETIRFITSYMARPEYTLDYFDMLLYYPRPFQDIIETYARLSDVPEPVFFALVRTECEFNADALSWAGAVGLSQLMDTTAMDMAGRIGRQGGPDYLKAGLSLKDPKTNIHIGTYYLGYLFGRMDNRMLALLAYNGGPTRVRRLREADTALPDDLFVETIDIAETREYGKRVSAAAAAYGYLYYQLSMEEIVADIFKER